MVRSDDIALLVNPEPEPPPRIATGIEFWIEDEARNRLTEVEVGQSVRLHAVLRRLDTYGGLGGKAVYAYERTPDGTLSLAIPLPEEPEYPGLYRIWRKVTKVGTYIFFAGFGGDDQFAGCEEEVDAGVGEFEW